MNHPISLALHEICEKFCCSLKMQKWQATNPTAKGMTVPTNNQQCKALNINSKTKNPSRVEHMGAAGD